VFIKTILKWFVDEPPNDTVGYAAWKRAEADQEKRKKPENKLIRSKKNADNIQHGRDTE
jgi:hypothetical protein